MPDVFYVDVTASVQPFISRIQQLFSVSGLNHGQPSVAAALHACKDQIPSRDDFGDLTKSGLNGYAYWLAMFQGYIEYCRAGTVTCDNTYYVAMERLLFRTEYDFEFARFVCDQARLSQRLQWRLDDLTRFAEGRYGEMQPIVLINPKPGGEGRYAFRVNGRDEAVSCDAMDGYHRVFGAWFFGVRDLRATAAGATPS